MQDSITLGVRMNNPFNIRFNRKNHWEGRVWPPAGKDWEFERFISLPYGLRAGFKTLETYINKRACRTIPDIISRYAPRSENQTDKYISFVVRYFKDHSAKYSSWTLNSIRNHNLSSDDDIDMFNLMAAICAYESRYVLTPSSFYNNYPLFRGRAF